MSLNSLQRIFAGTSEEMGRGCYGCDVRGLDHVNGRPFRVELALQFQYLRDDGLEPDHRSIDELGDTPAFGRFLNLDFNTSARPALKLDRNHFSSHNYANIIILTALETLPERYRQQFSMWVF